MPAATAESVNENYFDGLEPRWTSGSVLMRRQSSWVRKLKIHCPLFRTPLAWWPNLYGFSYFGTQIIGGCGRHTVTSAAMTILNQLGYELYSNCSAHCTRTSTLPHKIGVCRRKLVVNRYEAIAAYLVPTTFTSVGTRIGGRELLRHTRARVAASFWENDFRHEVFPFAANREGIRSATRLWSTN